MALIKASYTVHRAKAYAGMIADTSLYNVDGTCAAEKDIKVGVAVALSTTGGVVDGHKVVVDTIAEDSAIVGVTVMSHAYSPEGVYEEGSATNVLTHGRAWVLCEKALTEENRAFGKFVSFNTNGVASDTGTETLYSYTGEWFKTDDEQFDIVKIQVVQNAGLKTAVVPGV